MSQFTIYLEVSGEILWEGSAPDGMEAVQAATTGHAVIIGNGYDGRDYYIDLTDPLNPTPTPRPTLATPPDKTTALADGVDLVSFTGLPNPTDYEIAGPATATGTTTTGALQFTFDFPGDYVVTIKAFPYLDQVFTVTAT